MSDSLRPYSGYMVWQKVYKVYRYVTQFADVALFILFFRFWFYSPSKLFHSFHRANRKVGRKREIPEKKRITTHKQNLNWLVSHMTRARGSNSQRWGDERFRALNIRLSVLNYSATVADLPFWDFGSDDQALVVDLNLTGLFDLVYHNNSANASKQSCFFFFFFLPLLPGKGKNN